MASSKKKSKNSKNKKKKKKLVLKKNVSFPAPKARKTGTQSSPKEIRTPKEVFKNSTQKILGIRQILGGMICMDSGQVIGIQEIIPINFYQKTTFEKNAIYESFKSFFRICPLKVHFKMRTEKADVNKLINNILKQNENADEGLLDQMEQYIIYIRDLQKNQSLCKKFYIIFEYEGENGKRSADMNVIYREIESMKMYIRNVFTEMGHLCVNPSQEDIDYYVCEILYKFYNPKSSLSETLAQRYQRIETDKKIFNSNITQGEPKEVYYEDYIAPRGIKRKSNYILMDGIYHTFVTLRDNGHPSNVYAGWTDLLSLGLGYDVDIWIKKLPYDQSLAAIEQWNRISRVRAQSHVFNKEKYEEMTRSVRNKEYITNRMKNYDEDLWDCMIIVTVRGESYQDMMTKVGVLMKNIKSKGMYADDSFMIAWHNFRMIEPVMNFDEFIFNRNKRNYLTSSAASLYNFTAYELFDDSGVILGLNSSNGSIVALNNFNTSMYSNANMLLLGASGSGKTFTEQMLGRRMLMTGLRTYYILPVKGHEYYDGIKALGGEIIRLFPGEKACINIMEIRPEANIDKDALGEDIAVESTSLLTKKIVTLQTFIQLLMPNERLTVNDVNKLNKIITEVYKRFGVTNDNDSIFRDKEKGIIKDMPLLQDLYDALSTDDTMETMATVLLPFIEGSYQNFNAPTNVNLSNRCTVFDVNADAVGEVFLPAIMFIAFDCVYDLVKQDIFSKDVIFLDEVWKMLNNDECAKQVQRMVKLIRGYAGAVVIATQDIEDFLNQQGGFGKSIISNTELKLLLKLKIDEIKAISEVIDLNDADKNSILKMQRGHALIAANGDKIAVKLEASPDELCLFTTDPNERERVAKRRTEILREASKKRKKYSRDDSEFEPIEGYQTTAVYEDSDIEEVEEYEDI